jgi:hypothetical protein
MPPLSLVVCVCHEGDFLRRLLQASPDCYDDLVVVHDGPDTTGVRTLVESAGGRFFEGLREYQQEPHWPFAWGEAKCDWILRLDADEFPSAELQAWLQDFRRAGEPAAAVSGYTCIWPLWNGRRAITRKIPRDRIFLLHKQRVRFFGMVEQVPVPDGQFEAVDLVLQHQPARKSHGLYNILVRRQAWHWRAVIAESLLGKPTDLPCWRWASDRWPFEWEQIRRQPLWTALKRLVKETIKRLREQWHWEKRIFPLAALAHGLHLPLLCVKFWRLRRLHPRNSKA